MGCVYKATNTENGKIYIGKTIKTLEQRRKGHEWDSKKPKYVFQRAIKKYGVDSFVWEELYRSNNEVDLLKEEARFIKSYNATNPHIGYNILESSLSTVGKTKESLIKEVNKYIKDFSKQKESFKKMHNEMVNIKGTIKIFDMEEKYLPLNMFIHLEKVVSKYRERLNELKLLDGTQRYKMTCNAILEVN